MASGGSDSPLVSDVGVVVGSDNADFPVGAYVIGSRDEGLKCVKARLGGNLYERLCVYGVVGTFGDLIVRSPNEYLLAMMENGVVKPVGSRLLLEEPERTSDSAIFLPDHCKSHMLSARVIAVGDGVVDVGPGDMVLYNPFQVSKLDGHGLLIDMKSVYAVV